MSSPGSKRSYEATLDSALAYPSSEFGLVQASNPQHSVPMPHETSSRASTPLSSVPDHISTRPSSSPSAMKQSPHLDAPAAKKQKLTFAEKETLRIEKEFKAQAKAEEKARREAEKEAKKEVARMKAEEQEQRKKQKEVEREEKRKQLEEAKEEKRKAKEAEISAKETERRAREEEKAKKERSQMRLNAFFITQPTKAISGASSRRSSITSLHEGSPTKPQLAAATEKLEDTMSAYDKMFPAFFLHTNTTLAPIHKYDCPAAGIAQSRAQIDAGLCSVSPSTPPSLKRTLEASSHELSPKRRKLGRSIFPVKGLIAKLQGTSSAPIDLTQGVSSEQDTAHSALRALGQVPVKYLRYEEDVRPPYIGTFTRLPTTHSVAKLCRNPFIRALPEVNYDYDSEAEWDEPEEGEDLNSDDDEEDADSDAGDDMRGFLDDEEDGDTVPKRRNVMGNMEPVCTPLFWQAAQLQSAPANVPYGSTSLDLAQFRIAPLLVAAASAPIDPFSQEYWASPASSSASPGAAVAAAYAISRGADAWKMAPPPPPRVPLNTLHGPNTAPTAAMGSSSLALLSGKTGGKAAGMVPGLTKPAAKAVKPFPPDLLPEFRRAIEGSDLSKLGLIEVLKKRFPQVTGKTVSETLPLVARREGKSAAEKKWVLF